VLGTNPGGDSANAGTGASSDASAPSGTAASGGGLDATASGAGGAAGATSGGTGGVQLTGPLGPTQSWTGYVENFNFDSGSDAIKLTFATDADGQIAGQVVFGAGTPPPPATDPNVGYPPSLMFGQKFTVAEGFPYTIGHGTLSSQRLRFTVPTWQLWTQWCALQTPAPGGMCAPNWSGMKIGDVCSQKNPATGQSVAIDCEKLFLCNMTQTCTCTAQACSVNALGDGVPFDVFLTGDSASGSINFAGNDRNVHFTRDP
jgi:hypothetical protein